MSKLTERADRDDRAKIRDVCLKKAVTLATQLDNEPDAASLNRDLNIIQTLSQLAIAITLRDG